MWTQQDRCQQLESMDHVVDNLHNIQYDAPVINEGDEKTIVIPATAWEDLLLLYIHAKTNGVDQSDQRHCFCAFWKLW